MKQMEKVAFVITESIFDKVITLHAEDQEYLELVEGFTKKRNEIQSLSNNNEEILFNLLDIEEICSTIENRVSRIAFLKGFLYGIGFYNEIKNININDSLNSEF